MRQIYSRSFTITWLTGDSGYVLSDKIPPGFILHVHSCCAYSPARDISDRVNIGIRNGGEDLVIGALAPLAAQDAVQAATEFFVGEGDQVFAYFPDASNGDKIGIHLNGVIMTLSDWEEGPE